MGGDRFAANLVVLPHGLYYGQVTPVTAAEVAGRHEAGDVHPTWLRGRSSLSAVEQAAQYHAMLATGDTALDALPPLATEALGPASWRVRLGHPDGSVLVTVSADRDVPPARLTCHSTYPEHARVFRLVSVVRTGGTGGGVGSTPGER